MNGELYYIHDPMCSWCWGFAPTIEKLESSLSASIAFRRVLGGLAPDSNVDMPMAMQQGLQQTWKQIQHHIPGTRFNFDFWTQNTPRRSTWPACRAVIAARDQDPKFEKPMITAVQQAYYLNAQNPSDKPVLVDLAKSIGCNDERFSDAINSQECISKLQEEIRFSQQLGVNGFPSLVLSVSENQYYRISIDYRDASVIEKQIVSLLTEYA